MASKTYLLIFPLSVAALVRCAPVTPTNHTYAQSQTMKIEKASANDRSVIEDVREFSRDEGRSGSEAWKRLQSYSRRELTDYLAEVQKTTPDTLEGQTLKVDIAFTLCNLDYEYPANRQIIVTAFTTMNYSFGEACLLHRLVSRGDHELLPVLFSASKHSDGAVSESLADTFAEQMRSNPEKFLLELKDEPQAVRRSVYALLDESVLSEEDVVKIKQYLAAVPKGSPIAAVAKEMSAALPARLSK